MASKRANGPIDPRARTDPLPGSYLERIGRGPSTTAYTECACESCSARRRSATSARSAGIRGSRAPCSTGSGSASTAMGSTAFHSPRPGARRGSARAGDRPRSSRWCSAVAHQLRDLGLRADRGVPDPHLAPAGGAEHGAAGVAAGGLSHAAARWLDRPRSRRRPGRPGCLPSAPASGSGAHATGARATWIASSDTRGVGLPGHVLHPPAQGGREGLADVRPAKTLAPVGAALLPTHTAAAAATFLRDDLVPHFRRAGWHLQRVLTDAGPSSTDLR